MRIGLISSAFLPAVGGMEWKVHYLASEYRRRGHDVAVFTSPLRRSQRHLPMPVEPTYAVVRCGVRVPGIERLGLTALAFRRAVVRRHREAPFDVLHCHHLGPPTSFGLLARRTTGVPVVATACGGDIQVVPEIRYGDRLTPRFDRMVRRNVREADVVGSISASVREELARIGATARIVDIPNGLPWERFQQPADADLRRRLGLPGDAVIVLSVGRNQPVKGYDVGLAAFARAARADPRAVYVLVGRDIPALAPLAADTGVADRIHLLPEVPQHELIGIYQSADVFFSPSLIEGFSQVNVQAMACGLPCVLSDAPGNRDAGVDGGAIVARSGDPEALGAALAGLTRDHDRRRRLGDEARLLSRRYDWGAIAEAYLDVFSTLRRRDDR